MASPAALYQREMHDNLGFFATWLPADPIAVGDVGTLEGGRFRKASSLDELGIEYAAEDAGAGQDVQYTSGKGTRISASAGAEAATLAQARIEVEFTHSGAFVFHASALRQRRIRERGPVERQVLRMMEAGSWRREWLLVESVHAAGRATIIVCEDNSAGLVLTASAPLAGVSLADPEADLSIASTRGRMVHVVGGQALHPLYSCLRIKKPVFGDALLRPVRGPADEGESRFSRPGIDELLDS